MEVNNRPKKSGLVPGGRWTRAARRAFYYLAMTLCLLSIFHSSLLLTSQTLAADDAATVTRAIDLLDRKGFSKEAFWLRRLTVFRASDNWLNSLAPKENAFAATNFPFNIVTLYPDFFSRAKDDTERAAILLHELQHMHGAGEHDAYEFVWRNRQKLGWTMLTHGTTESYITIEILTRESVPELFRCTDKLWDDCTAAPKPVKIARAAPAD